MAGELAGKIAIVTGGANGIGRATVQLFVEEGAKVIIADVNQQAGTDLAEALGENALFRCTDVSSAGSVQEAVRTAISRFGRLDVMFNNAGIAGDAHSRCFDDDFEDFERVMRVDLLGVMLGCKYAGEVMANTGGGSIINTSSIGGSFGGFGVLTYRAAKAGVIAVTKSLAIDFGEYNIRVNSISPGPTDTGIVTMNIDSQGSPELSRRIQQISMDTMKLSQPLARTGTAQDVAQAALFLASDRSSQISGLDMKVDGACAAGYPHNTLAKMQENIAAALAAGE